MTLKVYIIEDNVSEADKIKKLLEKAYKNENWKEHFKGISVKDDDIEIIRGSVRGKDDNGKDHLFYQKDDVLGEMKKIVNQREKEEVIGISLDIKLTEAEEKRESGNRLFICETAQELYKLRGDGVHICPMTTLANFDERSYDIIGESVEEKYINRNFLVDEEAESALFSLAYFLIRGEMPVDEVVDEIFGYD